MTSLVRALLTAGCAMTVSLPAEAAVRYVGSIQGIGSIDYTVASFITVNPTDVSPTAANCALLVPGLVCTNVRFLPNPAGFDTLAINYTSVAGGAGGTFTAAGSFAPGAFGAYGTYTSVAPDTTSQLTVSQVGAVPEPATWGMMIVGFAFAGGVHRRRARSTPAMV